jgi:hypothetical protein
MRPLPNSGVSYSNAADDDENTPEFWFCQYLSKMER